MVKKTKKRVMKKISRKRVYNGRRASNKSKASKVKKLIKLAKLGKKKKKR